ncbi:SH3 domain-containing protein [Butyricimonas paravirosa]
MKQISLVIIVLAILGIIPIWSQAEKQWVKGQVVVHDSTKNKVPYAVYTNNRLDSIPIREYPTDSAVIIKKILPKTLVDVTEETSLQYYKISYQNLIGYISTKYLKNKKYK